jgi:hypothetical protein
LHFLLAIVRGSGEGGELGVDCGNVLLEAAQSLGKGEMDEDLAYFVPGVP